MKCTHPVLYERKEGLFCQVCGAAVRKEEQEKKPEEKPKTGRKRKAKTAE